MAKQSRAKAIRLKCMDCCCQQQKEVRLCPATQCPLWMFRMGAVSKAFIHLEKPTEDAEIDELDEDDDEE